jgi:xanthine dehydrogenase YagT iron-sulfur-binding subunit
MIRGNAMTAVGRHTDAGRMLVQARVNGNAVEFDIDVRSSLLDALRGTLGLTGTKKGCDHGQCGACTIHVNGRRVLSCLTLAATTSGAEITTIEGLVAEDGSLHPMQEAFLGHDALQCGFCTPGQIMSAVALLEEAGAGQPSAATPDVAHPPERAQLSDAEIQERMSGNICRCGAYPFILAAVRSRCGDPR